MNERKRKLLKSLVEAHPELRKKYNELIDKFEEDGVLDDIELEIIIDEVQKKAEGLPDLENKEEITNALEEIRNADLNNIEQIEAKVDELVDAPVEENVETAEATEESVEEETYDDSYETSYNELMETCSASDLAVEMKPGDDLHRGFDTFSIEVSPSSQHVIDALLALNLLTYECNFEVVNGKYCLSIVNSGSGIAENISSIENMMNTIKDVVASARKDVNYLENRSEDTVHMQGNFEELHPEAEAMYYKQDKRKMLEGDPNYHGDVLTAIDNAKDDGNLTIESNQSGYNIVANGEPIATNLSERDAENLTNTDYNSKEDVAVKTNEKTMVKTLGTYPGSGYNGFASIATLILGLGLGAGLIALFILFA